MTGAGSPHDADDPAPVSRTDRSGEPAQPSADEAPTPRTAGQEAESCCAEVDAIQETDLWIGAPATQAMIPSFVVCGLLMAVIVGATYVMYARYHWPYLEMRYTAYGLSAGLWIVQLGRWIYRSATFSYRLTTRRLLIERSFFSGRRAQLLLNQIVKVTVERGALQRRLGVGDIRVAPRMDGLPVLVLQDVCDPEPIAHRLGGLVDRVLAGEVICAPEQSVWDMPLSAGHVEGEI